MAHTYTHTHTHPSRESGSGSPTFPPRRHNFRPPLATSLFARKCQIKPSRRHTASASAMPAACSAKTRLSTRRGVALVPGFHTGAITRQVNGPSPSGVSAVFLGIQFPPKTESRKNRGARTAALSRRLTVANRASKSVVMDADGFERVFVCVFFLSFSLSRHFTTRLSRITANRSEATGHSTHRRSGFIFCPQANASDGDDRDGRKLAKNFVENHDH